MIFTGEMLSLLNTKFSEKSNLLYIFKDISSEDLILKGEEREIMNQTKHISWLQNVHFSIRRALCIHSCKCKAQRKVLCELMMTSFQKTQYIEHFGFTALLKA